MERSFKQVVVFWLRSCVSSVRAVSLDGYCSMSLGARMALHFALLAVDERPLRLAHKLCVGHP